MKTASLIAVSLLTALSQAQVTKMNIEYAGTKAGTSVYELKPDGTFSSESRLTLGTITLGGTIKGQMNGSKIVSYEAESQGPQGETAKTVWNGSKVTTTMQGKIQERDVKYDGTRYFGNLHPQFVATTLQAVDWNKKEAQPIETFILDSVALYTPKVTPKLEKPTKAGLAKIYLMSFGNVDIEFAMDGKGTVVGVDVASQKIRFIADGWESLYVDPLAAYPELSQPTMEMSVDKAVKMKMRDGVTLVADVFRPAGEGKYPVVLSRTPYGRATAIDGAFYAKRGYVYVSQDCRGRGDSDGNWDPFVNERVDGYDTVDWVSKQPWSDGNVGMIGGSYGGLVQWAAAVEKHPALKCLIPQVSPPDAMRNIPYDMGIFFLFGNLWWGQVIVDKNANLAAIKQTVPNLKKLGTLPLSKVDDAVFGRSYAFYDTWLDRVDSGSWKGFDWVPALSGVKVPALHISGWWDGDGIGTKTNWEAVRSGGAQNQWLIYGPWTHAFNTTSKLGDVDYGPTAIMELESLYLRWFDTWLKGKDVALTKVPKVRVFVTGANKWMDLPDWPSKDSAEKKLYLYADAPANGKTSLGELRDAPAKEQEPSRYLYNPAYAEVPEELLTMDPEKASTVIKFEEETNSDDSLVYKSAPLTKPMAIGGPLDVELQFETSARDTDFYALLVDVDEKGVMRQIGKAGKIRCSYLGGFDKVRPLTPGKTYKAKIELWDLAHEFGVGHRIGLFIISSMFPVYARNLGTGEPIKDATRMVVQANTIYHDAARPSFVSFRVLY